MKDIDDQQIGKAGCHMVCADLIMRGYIAFIAEEGLPYDVVLDDGKKLHKIQVKTTRTVRAVPQRKAYTPAYLFYVKRCGKHGAKRYQEKDFNFMALVALDARKVAYIMAHEAKSTIHLNNNKFDTMLDVQRVL